jgi:hypothetical protein
VSSGTHHHDTSPPTMTIVFVPNKSVETPYPTAIVRSHVAKLAAERRRRNRLGSDNRNAQAGALPTVPSSQNPGTCIQRSRSQSAKEVAVINQADDDEQRRETLADDISQLKVTALQKGNSDPFDSTTIAIDATANELLTFNRNYFLPLIDSFERSSHKIDSYQNKFYEIPADAMHNECTAASTLARYAMVLSNLRPANPYYRVAAAKYTALAYKNLRASFSSGQDDRRYQDQLKRQVFAVVATETLGRNFEAAAVHMRSLQKMLLQDQSQGLPVSQTLLQSCCFIDLLRSTLSTTRPIFNVENFACFDPDPLILIAAQLTNLGFISLNAYFQSPEIPLGLRPYFAQIRWICIVSGAFFRANGLVTLAVTNSWAEHAYRAIWDISSSYFDARDAIQAVASSDPTEMNLQAVIALATLFWLAADANFDYLPPTNEVLWKVVYPTLSRARRVMPELKERINMLGRSIGPNVRLWLLYVTSLAEQAETSFLGVSAQHENDWHVRFVQQAIEMGLTRYEDVEKELKNFLYHERTRVDGKVWFERCLCDLTSDGAA